MKVRRRRLSRIQLRSRRLSRGAGTCSARTRSSSGTRRRALPGADVVILPGGFSHGDYLRTGAIARFSPIMAAVAEFAARGRPGARHLQRLPDPARGRPAARRDAAQPRPEVPLRARRRPRRADRHAVHARALAGQVLRIPIAHGEGNYFADAATSCASSKHARPRHLPLLRRATARSTDAANPNGSIAQHRRHLQRRAQRRRADAASGARLRAGARQRRRPRAVRVGGRLAGRQRRATHGAA